MKKSLIIVSIIATSILVLSKSYAGIGDGSGPFEERSTRSEENSSFGTTTLSSTFGTQPSIEAIADIGDPPTSPLEVPLDGGASLLLLGGAALGISRSFKKIRRNVFNR